MGAEPITSYFHSTLLLCLLVSSVASLLFLITYYKLSLNTTVKYLYLLLEL